MLIVCSLTRMHCQMLNLLCCLRLVQGSAGPAMVALVQQGLGWVPTACNLATALAFGLSLSLNASLTGGSDLAIFALAPLLLLLTQVQSTPCLHGS